MRRKAQQVGQKVQEHESYRAAARRGSRQARGGDPRPAAGKGRSGRLLLLNKPYGVLCQFGQDADRLTLKSYVSVSHVYPAGRLDKESEGLVLLADDGWMAHQITHPRYKLPKVYLVQVEGVPGQHALAALRAGVEIPDKREAGRARIQTAPAEVELLSAEPALWPRSKPVRPYGEKRWLRLVIQEGKKHQIRHMTAAVDHPTLRLIRVAIGPLQLGDLLPGQWRDATPEEWTALQNALHRHHR